MLSIITDYENHQLRNKLLDYESIFKHYNLETQSPYVHHENEKNIEINNSLIRNRKNYLENLYERKPIILEKNESNKKVVNAKTIVKKSKQTITKHSPTKTKQTTFKHSSTKSKQSKKSEKEVKKKHHNNVIKITVPDAAKARKATYSQHQYQQPNKNVENTKVALHAPSSSTIKTEQKLPTFESKTNQSISNTESNIDQMSSQTIPFNQANISEQNSTINSPTDKKQSTLTTKSAYDLESIWDLDEVNTFIKEIFKYTTTSNKKPTIRSRQVQLKCAVDDDDHLNKYVQSRSYCLDVFDEYVTSLKRQHGVVQNAAIDPPLFDPGISITGPYVKKDTALVDKEDSQAIKKMINIEPRKKYALIHEKAGIFIIGGYNLYVDVPSQREPETDYLFKVNGDIVKISPLRQSRVHFGIFTDGDAIYVAGGQTIHNELLADIQRLNLKTFKWEHVTTLMNPIAACGITIDNRRIYLVGGYDIIQNQTSFLFDYTIYNLATQKFEKSTDLPTPRCRSLVFANNNAIFAISGLTEDRDENNNKKIKISTDVLKWTQETSKWIKISQTPELTRFHALAFNDPYLEITKRAPTNDGKDVETIAEAYYDFRTNTWTKGRAPSPTNPKSVSPTPKSPGKSVPISSPKTPQKTKSTKAKSPSKTKVCQHRPYECIQVSYRGIIKCITNFNRLTTVAHIIDALLNDLAEEHDLTINDCCLYVERSPYLFPLKSTDFIQDILLRYTSSNIKFKLAFKRNSSPSRYAQRKKLNRTQFQETTAINAYEQLKIQESLIRKQHEIITQLKKTNSLNNQSNYNLSSNYSNYFDWITKNNNNNNNSDSDDNSRTSSDMIPISRRQSRQDEYCKTRNSNRSLSRVRFRTNQSPSTTTHMKSILKNVSSHQRISSVDRDITRLITSKQQRNSFYISDDDNLSDRSTTDSCLGSLSSDDNNSYIITQHHLETLV